MTLITKGNGSFSSGINFCQLCSVSHADFKSVFSFSLAGLFFCDEGNYILHDIWNK